MIKDESDVENQGTMGEGCHKNEKGVIKREVLGYS